MLPKPIPSAPRRAPSLLCVAALFLAGCSGRYVYEDFRAVYQAPEVPTQFATGTKGWRLAGHFSYNNQGTMEIARRDTLWAGPYPDEAYFERRYVPEARRDSFRLMEERYRFTRSGGLLGVTALYQRRHWFAGMAMGAAVPDRDLFHIGVVGGYTQFFGAGRWAPLISGGIFLNTADVAARGWSHVESIPIGEYAGPSEGAYRRAADTASTLDAEMPIKLGLLFRAHPAFQPYLLLYGTTISTWPRESEDEGRFEVDDSGVGLGIRNQSYRNLLLSLEADLMEYAGPMNFEGTGVKVSFSAEIVFGS